MLVYLIRHAPAVSQHTPNVDNDAMRHLSDQGIVKMRRACQGMARLGTKIEQVWTSPLLRCRQTAEILREELAIEHPARVIDELAPGVDTARLAGTLEQGVTLNGLALVGHQPDMGHCLMHLLAGTSCNAVRFKKGAVACLEVIELAPPRSNELRWFLTPKQLALIAQAPRP